MNMNKKQFFFLWVGIIALFVGGLISIIEKAYLPFLVWFVIVLAFITGAILTFAHHPSAEITSSVQSSKRLFLWILIAIITAIALAMGSLILIESKHRNDPKWWLNKAEQEAIQIPQNDWYRDDIGCKIVCLYIDHGDVESACSTLSKMHVRGIGINDVLTHIAKMKNKDKKTEIMHKLRKYLEQEILNTDDLDNQAWLSSRLAEVLVGIGEFDSSTKIAENIRANNSARGYAFASIMKNMLASGKIDEVKGSMEKIEDSSSKLEVFGLMAEAKMAHGDTKKAKELLQKSIELYQGMEGFDRIISFDELVKSIIKIDGSEAAKTFGIEVNKIDNALSLIAIEQAHNGKIQESQKTSKEINDSYYYVKAFIGIAKELAKDGKPDKARELLYEAKKTLKEEDKNKDLNLEKITVTLAEIGYIDSSLFYAEDIKDKIYKSAALAVIAKQQAIKGNSDAAIGTLSNANENNYSRHEIRSACYSIGKTLANEGRTKILLRWTQSLSNCHNRANAFCGAADGLIKYPEQAME